MDAKRLYEKLDKDFDLEKCRDGWKEMDFNSFISDNFKKRRMGIVLDNSKEIIKVYTAVFPSKYVLTKVLSSGENNVLIFTHHPMIWDLTQKIFPFRNISKELLQKLRDNKISLYTLHVPLDKNGRYSTTSNLARTLGITQEGEFAEYYGVKVGVYGKTTLKTVKELADRIKQVVGHNIKLWNYGEQEIKDSMVALVAGGGNDPDMITEVIKLGMNTYITGVTRITHDYQPSIEFHSTAKKNKLNIIGATHYSTEKFACIAMLDYFRALEIPAEFVEDSPCMNDLI